MVIPLAPGLFSLQGLKNLGPTLRDWRKGWKKRLGELPAGAYVEAVRACYDDFLNLAKRIADKSGIAMS